MADMNEKATIRQTTNSAASKFPCRSYILADSNRMYRQMRETQPGIKWRLVMDALIGARK
jgi:hypothetical protein